MLTIVISVAVCTCIIAEIVFFPFIATVIAGIMAGEATGAGSESVVFQKLVVYPAGGAVLALTCAGFWVLRKDRRSGILFGLLAFAASVLLVVIAAVRLFQISNVGG